jgi:hypothetical protein
MLLTTTGQHRWTIKREQHSSPCPGMNYVHSFSVVWITIYYFLRVFGGCGFKLNLISPTYYLFIYVFKMTLLCIWWLRFCFFHCRGVRWGIWWRWKAGHYCIICIVSNALTALASCRADVNRSNGILIFSSPSRHCSYWFHFHYMILKYIYRKFTIQFGFSRYITVAMYLDIIYI